MLAIRGYEFELRLGLTQAAQKNLDDATAYLSSGGASGVNPVESTFAGVRSADQV